MKAKACGTTPTPTHTVLPLIQSVHFHPLAWSSLIISATFDVPGRVTGVQNIRDKPKEVLHYVRNKEAKFIDEQGLS